MLITIFLLHVQFNFQNNYYENQQEDDMEALEGKCQCESNVVVYLVDGFPASHEWDVNMACYIKGYTFYESMSQYGD